MIPSFILVDPNVCRSIFLALLRWGPERKGKPLGADHWSALPSQVPPYGTKAAPRWRHSKRWASPSSRRC